MNKQTMIDDAVEIQDMTKELLDLIEDRFGAPPNLSYLSSGYLGDDLYIRNITETKHCIRRAKAIIWNNASDSKIRTKEQCVPDEYLESLLKHNPLPLSIHYDSSIESKKGEES